MVRDMQYSQKSFTNYPSKFTGDDEVRNVMPEAERDKLFEEARRMDLEFYKQRHGYAN